MIGNRLISQINISLSKDPKIKLAYVLGSFTSGRAKTDSDFDLAVSQHRALYLSKVRKRKDLF